MLGPAAPRPAARVSRPWPPPPRTPPSSAPRSTTATSTPGAKLVPVRRLGDARPVRRASARSTSPSARRAGVFDVSHMGEIETTRPAGRGASCSACSPTTSTKLEVGGAQYGVLCREDGGVLDDLFTYRLATDRYLTVTNAANHDKDLAWFREHAERLRRRRSPTRRPTTRCSPSRARRRARSSRRIADGAAARALHDRRPPAAGRDALVCGTGYTGEDGVELLLEPADAPASGTRCSRRGAAPGRPGRARHAAPGGLLPPLRQRPHGGPRPDRGRPRLGCKEDTGFIGADAVARSARPARPRSSSPSADRRRASPARATRSSAAAWSPAARCRPASEIGIGMAYVPAEPPRPGTELEIDVRGKCARRRRRSRSPCTAKRSRAMADASYPDDLLYHAEHDWARIDGDTADVRHHLVRPGRARRGRVLRPARGRHAGHEGRALRRGRVGQGGLGRHRAAVGRDPRGQRRPRATRPRRSTTTPTARAGWSRCGSPTQSETRRPDGQPPPTEATA